MKPKPQSETIVEAAGRAAQHISSEAMPALRRAIVELRKIPDADLWLLDLQNVLGKLDVAVIGLVGQDGGKLASLAQARAHLQKKSARRAARAKGGAAS